MKKAFIILAMFLSVSIMAQNRRVVMQEFFDGNDIPSGWEIMEDGFDNWQVTPTTYAGDEANELHLCWAPYFTNPTRMVFNPVDLTGIYNVTFSFDHFVTHVTDVCTVSVETSSDGGNTWHRCFSRGIGYNEIVIYEESFEINNVDMGKPDVLFSIYVEPMFSSAYFDDWYFDDIIIMGEESGDVLDLGISTINIQEDIACGDKTMAMTVRNFGTLDITSVEASYQIDDNQPVAETFSVNIAPMETANLSFTAPANLAFGDYTITMNIMNVNGVVDDDQADDQMTKDITAHLGLAQRIPLLEVFSSSNCAPCAPLNAELQTFCDNNPDKYSYIKYCASYPYDPYFNPDVSVRGDYLSDGGLPFVPVIYMDFECLMNYAPTQEAFNVHYNTPSLADIRGSFYTEGSQIFITADVMSYTNMNNATVYVSVNEKVTTGNVGDNGETEFHHVMMKMLPDATGKNINFSQGDIARFEYNYDMSTTFVEEMNDLEVVVWIEEFEVANVLNSHFLYDTPEHPYPVENLTLMKNGTTFTASWDAHEGANPVGYNVTLNGNLVVENGIATDYSFTGEDDNFYVVEVQAVYNNDIVSVKRVITSYEIVAVDENEIVECRVFPNPTCDRVSIQAATTIQNAVVYDVMGKVLNVVNINSESAEMSFAGYVGGLYFIKLQMTDGSSQICRVVVAR